MSRFINGKTLCEMYSISKKQLAYMCHYDYLDCFSGYSNSKIYSSISKILKREPKFLRRNSVSALRYNNVVYTNFAIDKINSNYEKYFTLDIPEYLLQNKNLIDIEHFNRIDTSSFLWTLIISDGKKEQIKAELKKNRSALKLIFSYSIHFKIFKTKINYSNFNELFLNIENLKNKNIKIVVSDSSGLNPEQSSYCEVEFCEGARNQGYCDFNFCTNDLCLFNKITDLDKFECCQKINLSIILYLDRNNQVVIKLLNPEIPTTLTNYGIFAPTITDKGITSQSISTNYSLYAPIISEKDITNQFRNSEYLTLFDCLYSLAEEPSRKLQFKKNYFIFSQVRFQKLNYNVDEEELLKDFLDYIESLYFDEASVKISFLKLNYDEDCNNEKINKLIIFWEDFKNMHESILVDDLLNAIKAYISKLSNKCANHIVYDEVFNVKKKDKPNKKNDAKNDELSSEKADSNYKNKKIKRLFHYLDEYIKSKKLSEYYVSIEDLCKNKELIIKREMSVEKNCPNRKEGQGDEGIC